MVVSHLSTRIKSNQDWRNPAMLPKKRRSKFSGRKTKKQNKGFSISNKYKTPKNRGWFKKLLGALLPIIIFLILLGGIVGLGALAWISKDLPSPDKVISRNITVSTKIYDRTGETVLYDVHGDIKRSLIDLQQIPKHVINATLAAEDRNFFSHKGFSLTGIIRSVIKNIITGSRVGGSTLTQQFVKNAVLTTEKTYTRKIKELLISYQLEKKFTKNEILQMYFNEIPYGSVVYGVEAAAQTFFGKSVTDLSIAEGAILAAIPKAPTFYSPYGNNRDRLITRQRYIIDSMEELKYITPEQATAAKNEKIIFKPLQESIIAPHFVMYIKEILSNKYGESFINQEGLKVITSLDLDKQKIAEKAIKEAVANKGKQYQFTNASLVAIDPPTGQVMAMVGSADYFNNEIDGQVNVALRPRQPGSSLKPIIYTAAFIKGYTPDTILYDVVTDFDANENKEYIPHNYDLEEHGPVTIRKALAGSLNIPAVKITYLTGTDNILDLTDKLGYSTLTDRDRYGLSVVLGGGEVKLLEHVNAYATLAQEGIRHDISPILKIEDKNGRVLFEYKDKSKKIIEPEIARLTTDILSDDQAREYVFGLGSALTLPNRPVAAKTGTTNDYRDAWTIGYTPNLAAGVWVGNNDNTEMKRGAAGGVVAAPIWNKFMREALRDTAPEEFTAPEKIITGKPVLDGKLSAQIKIKIDTMSGKLATEYTPASTLKEISVADIHNILYFIDKDDPRGDSPANHDDPQYEEWEKSVMTWAKEQGMDPESVNQGIPTEYDDIHLAQDQPRLTVITPLDGQTINQDTFTAEVSATARRGISKIHYYVDGQLITTKNNTSDAILNVGNFDNGSHTLTVVAEDDLKNDDTKTINLNFNFPQTIPVLTWTEPTQNSTADFPVHLSANLTNNDRVKKIDVYFMKNGQLEQYLNSISSPGAQISILWDKKPEAGTYSVYANIFNTRGKKYISKKLKIIVK